nr:hypothetical protein GCM10025732_08490 [Glycomyces mayteni]
MTAAESGDAAAAVDGQADESAAVAEVEVEADPVAADETAASEPDAAATEAAPPKRDLAQLWVCGFLAVLGVLVIVDASRLGGFSASNDPIGPKPVPIILGVLLFAVAAFYALNVLRGGHGEDEERTRASGSTSRPWACCARCSSRTRCSSTGSAG